MRWTPGKIVSALLQQYKKEKRARVGDRGRGDSLRGSITKNITGKKTYCRCPVGLSIPRGGDRTKRIERNNPEQGEQKANTLKKTTLISKALLEWNYHKREKLKS